jgi:hypothetical protein
MIAVFRGFWGKSSPLSASTAHPQLHLLVAGGEVPCPEHGWQDFVQPTIGTSASFAQRSTGARLGALCRISWDVTERLGARNSGMASEVVSASGTPRGLGVFCEVWKSSVPGQCPTMDAGGYSVQIPISCSSSATGAASVRSHSSAFIHRPWGSVTRVRVQLPQSSIPSSDLVPWARSRRHPRDLQDGVPGGAKRCASLRFGTREEGMNPPLPGFVSGPETLMGRGDRQSFGPETRA